MIRIRAMRHSDGLEISAVGHAAYAERGRDIVCAAVSALLFGFLRYLTTDAPSAAACGVTDAPDGNGDRDGSGDRRDRGCGGTVPSVEYRMEDGFLWVRTHGMGERDGAAWALTRAGLSLVEEQHPTCVRLADTTEETAKP